MFRFRVTSDEDGVRAFKISSEALTIVLRHIVGLIPRGMINLYSEAVKVVI